MAAFRTSAKNRRENIGYNDMYIINCEIAYTYLQAYNTDAKGK